LRAAAAIRVPTLVLAHRQDPIHRFAFGEALARAIPGARLVALTPKSMDRGRHAAEVQRCLETFLGRKAFIQEAADVAALSKKAGEKPR
jgi:hypothetical protein